MVLAHALTAMFMMQIDNNGRVAPVQTAAATPESTVELQLMPRDKNSVDAVLVVNTNAGDTGDDNLSFTVPKSPEWTEVPIKTIAPIKTSVSLATDPEERSEEEGKEMVSIIPSHSHGECFQTGAKQEVVPHVTLKLDSSSQQADISFDEVKKHPTGEQSTAEERSSGMAERKLTCVAPRTVQEGLPKLAPVRLRSNDAKTPEAAQAEYGSGVTKTVESSPPVNVAGTENATPFGLGSYLDIPVGQDISSSGTLVVFLAFRLADSVLFQYCGSRSSFSRHALSSIVGLSWNGGIVRAAFCDKRYLQAIIFFILRILLIFNERFSTTGVHNCRVSAHTCVRTAFSEPWHCRGSV